MKPGTPQKPAPQRTKPLGPPQAKPRGHTAQRKK
jgi:hypothetical protein